MNNYRPENLLVVSAALRTIYQNISNSQQQISLQKLKDFTDRLNQIVDRAFEDPQGEYASAATGEPFEDVIALIWQIAWMLHQKGLDNNSLRDLRDQLQQLHGKLENLYEMMKKGTP